MFVHKTNGHIPLFLGDSDIHCQLIIINYDGIAGCLGHSRCQGKGAAGIVYAYLLAIGTFVLADIVVHYITILIKNIIHSPASAVNNTGRINATDRIMIKTITKIRCVNRCTPKFNYTICKNARNRTGAIFKTNITIDKITTIIGCRTTRHMINL